MTEPTNFFNTGKHCQVVLRHPLAKDGKLDLATLTDFDVKPNWHELKSSGLDGYTRTQYVFESAVLSFSLDRANAEVDNFCSALVQAYFLTGSVPSGSVYQTINEQDGSSSTTEFSGVSFKPDDLGSWKKEDRVPQKITGTAMAYRRL